MCVCAHMKVYYVSDHYISGSTEFHSQDKESLFQSAAILLYHSQKLNDYFVHEMCVELVILAVGLKRTEVGCELVLNVGLHSYWEKETSQNGGEI